MLIRPRDLRVTIPALLFDPQFYVFDCAIEQGLTKFLIVEESNLERAPFIDSRFEAIAQGHCIVSTRELFSLEARHREQRPQPVFIFHHAFVCSTLFARCLNQIDAFFSLKEPWILRRLADIKRSEGGHGSFPHWCELFTNYVRLLAKNYRSGRTPVIKATNLANNLLPDVLRFLPDHKVLLLHSDLESFLISNLKKPDKTRQKIPDMARLLARDGDFHQKYPEFCDFQRQTYLQLCASVWIASLYNFAADVGPGATRRLSTLSMDHFLADPAATLGEVARFFGHSPSQAELLAMTSGEVMSADAKHQERRFDRQQRRQEAEQLMAGHAGEIKTVSAWIRPLAEDLGLSEWLAQCDVLHLPVHQDCRHLRPEPPCGLPARLRDDGERIVVRSTGSRPPGA